MGTGALGGTLLPRRGERVGVGAVVGMARLPCPHVGQRRRYERGGMEREYRDLHVVGRGARALHFGLGGLLDS
jgi:hypothetical protein